MIPERYNEISPDLLKEILTVSLTEIYIFDAKTLRFIFASEGACKNLGYSIDELYNMAPYDINPGFTSETFRTTLKPLLTKEADKLVFESTHRRKDGSEYPVDVHLQMIEKDGRPVFLAIINDITEHKDTENALITQYNLSKRLLDAIPHPAWLITKEKKIIAQNEAGQDFGTKIGDYCWETIQKMKAIPADKREYYLKTGIPAPDTQCFFCISDQMFAQKKTINKEIEFDNRVWNIWWIPVDNETYLHYCIDITDNRLIQEEKAGLEKQLIHAQKMETVGTLAGGVAHDFNNILTAIIGYGQVALMKMSKDDPNRKYIENILEASDRAADLTQKLLTFSRKSISNKRPIELNVAIRDMQKLLKRVISEDIELNIVCSDEELTVLADRNQIDQVLMNLAVNAKDAMPNGGTFTIRTEKTTIEDGFVKTYGYGRPGQYALITVSDTGIGMDEKTIEHIFEPFFTTKEVGKGTGLGLSVVYGIIKQHNGYINVYSEPGLGTTFKIYLPIVQSETDKKTPQKDEDNASYLNGKETILLAEDNEQVREFIKIVLTEAGYNVIEAIDGDDAVKKFMDNRGNIQMLLFDLIMPKKTGNYAYDEINKLEPGIKVIFITGYSPELTDRNISLRDMVPVIYKPISPKKLLKEIRRVLGKNSL
ncbi:MAG: ATP-binding protein [Dissulfurimicrobium sp.]|uniref:ATP-binding protein n=1 Tax=Dissulfurimicrobium sp. TaxID=2022436 RepID=UPI00404B1742